MRLGAKPPKIWHPASEVTGTFNQLNAKLNRLMVLSTVWERLAGKRVKFWVLDAASQDTIYIKVKIAVARHELAMQSPGLIKELNKHFDKAWIKKIEII